MVDNRLDGVRFTVTWRADQQRASFPRDVQFLVHFARGEKAFYTVAQVASEVGGQDQIVERGGPEALVEFLALNPISVLENEDLLPHFVIPFANSAIESLGHLARTGDDPESRLIAIAFAVL